MWYGSQRFLLVAVNQFRSDMSDRSDLVINLFTARLGSE